jgi:hypothetical protein
MNRMTGALALVVPFVFACSDPGAAPELDEAEQVSELERLASQSTGVRFVTQNLYIGLDVFPIIASPPDQVPFAVAEGFANFLANRPADRMAAIADEIALIRPHLVGLQEVMRMFDQFPADTVLGNTTPNATNPVIDFLAVLQSELAKRGQRYEVVVEQLGADVELPRFDGVVDGVPVFTDLRSKFYDVILRRVGVSAQPLFAFNYAVGLPLPTPPGGTVRRNAVAVKATIGGDTFRFVSTHLEPFVPGVPDTSQPQLGQVAELIQTLATSFQPQLPTIVVGDFNSDAGVGASYLAMAGAGYTDVWNERVDFGETGFTCCQDVVLTHPDSRLFERIDLVWTRNLTLSQPVLAFTIGDRPFFRTRTTPRLWPSDHAGVASWLSF